ncbi:hypothetical protein ACSQ6I_02990 [Anabaena sp. WFMT]|uniref:hypothetical protein n=1 Tax=Anabaena sp. WFMT TaxID=3449730 RepID=UPI003F234CA5
MSLNRRHFLVLLGANAGAFILDSNATAETFTSPKPAIQLPSLPQISYLGIVQLGFIWKLILSVFAGLIGLIIGGILAILLTLILEWQSNRNSPPSESGSMGGVAWLGIGMFLICIISPLMAAIAIFLTTLYL